MASIVWGAAWRITIALACGWLAPGFAEFLACFVIAHLLALLVDWRASGRWAVASMVTLAAIVVLTLVSNHIADESLRTVRLALVAFHERTGRYPESLVELRPHERDRLPSFGLPGTLRRPRYHPGPPPLLSYSFFGGFGRRVIDIETGRTYELD